MNTNQLSPSPLGERRVGVQFDKAFDQPAQVRNSGVEDERVILVLFGLDQLTEPLANSIELGPGQLGGESQILPCRCGPEWSSKLSRNRVTPFGKPAH